MVAQRSASLTLGLVDLPPSDRAEIGMIVEEASEDRPLPWLVLYTDSCNMLIVDGCSDHESTPDQIVARLYDPGACPNDPYALSRPLDARSLLQVLARAASDLGRQDLDDHTFGRLRVKTVAASPSRTLQEIVGHMPEREAIFGNTHSQDTGDHHEMAPVAAMAQTFGGGVPRAPAIAAPTSMTEDDSVHAVCESWADVAIAIYSLMHSGAPAVARIDVPSRDPVRIDFRYRTFECDGSLNDFPIVPHFIRLRTEIVGPQDPPAVHLPGRTLDQLLWFIGNNAFGNAEAPWLCLDDRFRLHRWPNFTELNHTVEHMRLTAAMGNRFLSVDELAQSAGLPRHEVVRTLNAYSLMGLVQNSPMAPAAPTGFGESRQQETTEKRSLFGKIIRRLGL